MDSPFWVDTIASKVIKQWDVSRYRTEMGMGASGIPHVGSAGDAVRSYVVTLGIEDQGKNSELLAFSDDRDGLRKVPSGFPPQLERELGKPVSMINDPFGCHKSFALHISSLLEEAFTQLGIRYTLHRGNDAYTKGMLDKQIFVLLKNATRAGEIIKRTTGSEKFLTQLPFLPICEVCGRVYTTRAHAFLEKEKKVQYTCDLDFLGKARGRDVPIKGCGHQGEVGIRQGKLAWKVEFAARWDALDVHYEAYGKDILDSVRCNDAICTEILKRQPPVHSFYELFTERGGSKISKSKGNVFTPQKWMELATPQSLRLLFLKRLGTSRVVDAEAIPALMDEVDSLESVYHGDENIANKKEKAHKKRLFEYLHFLNVPKQQSTHISYTTIVNLARALPVKDKERIIFEILGANQQIEPGKEDQAKQRIHYATVWAGNEKAAPVKLALDRAEKKALAQLHSALAEEQSADDIQAAIFAIAKERGIQMKNFFRILYKILLGTDRGPRAGMLIHLMGQDQARKLIKRHV